MQELEKLVTDLNTLRKLDRSRFHVTRRWSFGDVDSNGVYYMPRLQHYAHQAFEELVLDKLGMGYLDLSRQSPESASARGAHDPPIPRMTFPVRWCHQINYKPMYAGELFWISFDAVPVDKRKVGVRAYIYDKNETLAAVVIWFRWAQELDTKVGVADIPAWFLELFDR
ncbi:MAG: hypothetical protein QNK37_12710 [Acidobacteriota bacterium]|nr:hypothetical protein [Acidobacteriota bacterium]